MQILVGTAGMMLGGGGAGGGLALGRCVGDPFGAGSQVAAIGFEVRQQNRRIRLRQVDRASPPLPPARAPRGGRARRVPRRGPLRRGLPVLQPVQAGGRRPGRRGDARRERGAQRPRRAGSVRDVPLALPGQPGVDALGLADARRRARLSRSTRLTALRAAIPARFSPSRRAGRAARGVPGAHP